MAKLYPPYLEGTIPAFYIKYDSAGVNKKGADLTVPFSMNASVAEASVAGFALRIKTIQTGAYIFSPRYTTDFDLTDGTAIFHLDADDADELTEGQYYKIQIAYFATATYDDLDALVGEDIGYYSTVGVVKCTSKGEISIDGLFSDSINLFTNAYTGVYDCSECTDQTEKVYSYIFNIYDENGDVFWTSDTQLHSSAEDGNYDISMDRASVREFSTNGKNYSIQYSITTLNGLELSTPKYKLTNDSFVAPAKSIEIIPTSNRDRGYVSITFEAEPDLSRDGQESSCYGEYLLSRSSEDDDYSLWVEINRFRLDDEKPSSVVITDYTVEQGKKYKYSLQQYNIWDLYSSRIVTDIVEAEFEDCYLYDGEKYLKIRYNPKITTFKTDILETKQDTIGGRFPFILRNGETNYKEFPIEGLIAQELDEDYLFMDIDNKDFYRTFSAVRNEENIMLQNAPIAPYDKNAPVCPLYAETDNLTAEQQAAWDNYHAAYEAYKLTTEYQQYIQSDAYIEYQNKLVTFNSIKDSASAFGTLSTEAFNNRTQELLDYRNINTEDELSRKGLFRECHDLTDENVAIERKFKLKILDWLNDGKPKLFKSPTEGNYIIRLINVSLSPETAIGRMLHNFKATAYEIAEVTYENLVKYGFLHVDEPSDYVGLWKSYDLEHDYEASNENGKTIIKIPFESNLISFIAQDMYPGDIIKIKYYEQGDYTPIQIGATGSYYFNSLGRTVTDLYIEREDGLRQMGTIHCYYKGTRITKFDAIKKIMLKTIPSLQFVGVDPVLVGIKDTNWNDKNNSGQYTEILYNDEYEALNKTLFRDTLNDHTSKSSSLADGYTFDSTFIEKIKEFEPGDIIQKINSTIYNHIDEKTQTETWDDKVMLLNLEQLTLRKRPCIPVYLLHSSGVYAPNSDSANMRIKTGKAWEQYTNINHRYQHKLIGEVSTTPFGRPWPIEELVEQEMLDPYSVFLVLEYMGDDKWVPLRYHPDNKSDNKLCYYDAFYDAWAYDYDTTFYINNEYQYDSLCYHSGENYSYDSETKKYTNITTGLKFDYISEDYGIYFKDNKYYYKVNNEEVEFNILDLQHILYVKIDGEYYPLVVYGTNNTPTLNDVYIESQEKTLTQLFPHTTSSKIPIAGINYYTRNDTKIDLDIPEKYYFYNLGEVDKLRIGSGVIAEATIQLKIIDYYTEYTNSEVAAAKQTYLDTEEFLQTIAETEELLEEADTKQQKGQALRDLYNILINGNKTSTLTSTEKTLINNLLSDANDKADLLLVGVYIIYTINTDLGNSNIKYITNFWNNTELELTDLQKINYLKNANLYKYYYDIQANYLYKTILLSDDELDELREEAIDNYNDEIDNDESIATDKKQILKDAYYEYIYEYGTFEKINQDYSLISSEYKVLNDSELQTEAKSDYYLTYELQNNSKIEEEDIANALSTTENLSGVTNKKLALDDDEGDGVIIKINDEIDVIEEQLEENKKEFFDIISDVDEKISNYNSIIRTREASLEIIRLLTAGETLSEIKQYYTDKADQIEKTIEEEVADYTNYINYYKEVYNETKDSLESVKTYQQIQDERDDDDAFDTYLVSFMNDKYEGIFIGLYKLYLLKNIINDDSKLDGYELYTLNMYYSTFDRVTTYPIKDYLSPYINKTLEAYTNTIYSDLQTLVNNIQYEQTSIGSVSFENIKQLILAYDNAKLYKDGLVASSSTAAILSDDLSTIKSLIDGYVATLTLSQIKNINNAKDLTAEKIVIEDDEDEEEEEEQSSSSSTEEINPDPTVYYTLSFNPLNKKALDPSLITTETSNYKYLQTLTDSEILKIKKEAILLVQHLVNLTQTFISYVNSGKIHGDNGATATNQNVIDYINTLVDKDSTTNVYGDYSTYKIEAQQVAALKTSLYNFNSIINSYLVELKKLSVFSTLIYEYNGKYNHNYDENDESSYHLIFPSPTTFEIYEADEDTYKFMGNNSYDEGIYYWYVQYILDDELDRLKTLLAQAELLYNIYEMLETNYKAKYNTYDELYTKNKAIYDSYDGTEQQEFYKGTNKKTISYYRKLVMSQWVDFINLLDIAYTDESERGLYIV